MLEYENKPPVLELEKKEATPLRVAESYYFACRSIGFAEQGGAFFRGETDQSPEEYFSNKYGWLESEDSLVDIAIENKAAINREYQRAHNATELLEDVPHETYTETPKMTVCVPIAINSESPERLRELLESIKKSQEDFSESLQVIFWTNTQSNAGKVDVATTENYNILRSTASQYTDSDVQIKTALDIIPSEDFSMSRLRQRYMDAFVGLAIENDYDAGHVVTWLDADAVTIGKDYFGKLYDQIREEELGFVHPRTDYAADWAKGENKHTYDDATRAFLANEIINRAQRNEPGAESYEYTEESGLTFTYLTFLLSGGCDTGNPVDESEGLMNGLRTSIALPAFESFQAIYGDQLNTTSPLDKEISSAHVALSGRRIYNNIQQHGIVGMPSDRLGGSVDGEYQLFTHDTHDGQNELDSDVIRKHLELRGQSLKSELARESIARVLRNLYGK